jgi:hypothetical protein
VSVRDELTPEQYGVMINAVEDADLNGVIHDYNLRTNRRRTGNALIAPAGADNPIRPGRRQSEVTADPVPIDASSGPGMLSNRGRSRRA